MSHHYAIFSARYAPLTGGVESYTQNLATELARRGNRVSIVTSKLSDSPDYERIADRIEVWRLPARSLMNARLPLPLRNGDYAAMFRQIMNSTIDRVLVNTRFYSHSLEGLSLARQLEVPTVVLDHGSAYLVLGNPVEDAALRAYEHAITALVKASRPIYAGVSAKSCAWLETFNIHTSHVLPNAIDAASFREKASHRHFRTEFEIDAEKTLVCFCGRLEVEKGAYALAQAAHLCGDGFEFLLAGEGSEREQIEALGLPQVHLLGTVSHQDLSKLMAESDLFCLPTRSEGFCTSVLEAASWGLPAVITDVGGVREVYGTDPTYAKILGDRTPESISQAILSCKQEGLVGHFPELERTVEEDHTWEQTATRLEALYDKA